MQSHIEREIQAIANAGNHAFFLYDLNRITQQIDSLRSLPSNVEVYYAMKANPHFQILNHVLHHQLIKGIEIASQGEAEKVLKHLPSLKNIMYTSPGKRTDELAFVMKNSIGLINVESLTEAYRIDETAEHQQRVLVRINTNREIHGAVTQMSSSTQPSPFGIGEENVVATLRKIQNLKNISVEGLHIFSASGVLDAQALLNHIDYACALARDIEDKIGQKFQILDFVGGIGVDYEGERTFDTYSFSAGLQSLIKKHNLEDKRLVFELGRYLVADAGYFCTTINDIKLSRGTKILICTAGINAHRRPQALKVNYPFTVLPLGKNYKYPEQLSCMNESVQIRGPLCTEVDVLSPKAFVQHAELGDMVVMHKSGAYGLTMSSLNFLSHPHVPE